MNKKFALSIIIPCYNVEKYVDNCLDSLKKQLKNIDYEIIMIDDCSTDKTLEVIKKRIDKKDLNIKLLENENNIGAGASRNKAIKEAKYEYISFIDSDDYVDDNYYEVMLSKIIKDKADIVACDIKLIFEDGRPNDMGYGCIGKVNKLNMINTGLAASPCNKIIKKELLLKYPFAEGIMNEDVASIIAILANASKVSYTSDTKYNYIQRSVSVQNSSLSIKRFDIFKSIDILKERIKDNKDYNNIMAAVAFQQLFLFYIYIIPREKNIFKRTKFLRLFRKLSKDYDLGNNPNCKENLKKRGKKAEFYFHLIFNLNDKGFSFLTSIIISLFGVYRSIKHSKFLSKRLSVIKNNLTIKDLVKAAKKQQQMGMPKIKVSVVVPNYNYEKFLIQRLYSILYQDYKINELIILDDCSSDGSRDLINRIVDQLKDYINIKKVYNKENSGTAFKQWKKGFELVNGDYVWIAEADDYCEKNMLSSLMKYIEEEDDIVLGYVDTAFIDANGVKTLKSIKPEIDIQKSGHWDNDFVNEGIEEIKNYSYLNCTIANVSSCIIKHGNYEEYLKLSTEFKQAGDWLFYVNVMKQGKILYVNKTFNYYRVHGNNVTSLTKKEKHVEEIKKIHGIIKKEFDLSKDHEEKMKKRIDFLKNVWDLK